LPQDKKNLWLDTGSQLIGIAALGLADPQAGQAALADASWAAEYGALYNRLLHDDEKEWIKANADRFAAQEKLSGPGAEAQAESRLEDAACSIVHCDAEFSPDSDTGFKYGQEETYGANDPAALAFVRAEMAKDASFLAYTSWDRWSDGFKRTGSIMGETLKPAGRGFVKGFLGIGTPKGSMEQIGAGIGGVWRNIFLMGTPMLDGIGLGAVGEAGDAEKAVEAGVAAMAGESVEELAGDAIADASHDAVGVGVGADAAESVEVPSARPTPKQSEQDASARLGDDVSPQVSFKDGQRTDYGTPGSVRPDNSANDNSACWEVKNYDLNKNASAMENTLARQAAQRDANLPEGMEQRAIIDDRGQDVTKAQRTAIKSAIEQKTGGLIKAKDVHFMTEDTW
jgi:hypothetical protein